MCWSFRCSWSIACRRCSNYILILDLTLAINGLGKDNCKTRRQTFKFWDLVRLVLGIWRYITILFFPDTGTLIYFIKGYSCLLHIFDMCLIHSFMCSYITICHHPSEPCLRSYFCKNLHISMELSYGFQFWKINAKKNCVHISWYMLLFLSRVCSSSGANILPIPTQAKTWERHQRKWFHDQNIITFTCHQQLLLQTYSKMMCIAMVIAVYPATLYG